MDGTLLTQKAEVSPRYFFDFLKNYTQEKTDIKHFVPLAEDNITCIGKINFSCN